MGILFAISSYFILQQSYGHLTKQQRSMNMSRISSTETSPECQLRIALFKLGYRYRKNVRQLPGKPDLVLKKYNSIIFVNGCFWHHHAGCIKASIPKTNKPYWEEKLKRNINRDYANLQQLKDMGWKVITIWECEINQNFALTLSNVVQYLHNEQM